MTGAAGDVHPDGLDWPGLMRAGIQGLGLKPREFWALTPAELALMLGLDLTGGGGGPMNRVRLAELAARFPDAPEGAAPTG
ncbi:phage tail assembly chaperone [Paracoccus suum]|uniref:Phage tail assembly chaperone n=1 Tax=Paracoccus suum TaxID=2259340 RepID=A0A344PL99_9RHOB|nr:rcc01693 family protein [Paracoccus suum]AXC50154.1 phage tail assembly chaperone [Paracoccus suum]